MCDCRSDWVMCFRRDCERAAALNEATSSRSNEHLNLLMTPVGASKGQQAMAVAMMYPEPAKGAGSLKNSEFQALVFTGLELTTARVPAIGTRCPPAPPTIAELVVCLMGLSLIGPEATRSPCA
jgi:hypothetical protein